MRRRLATGGQKERQVQDDGNTIDLPNQTTIAPDVPPARGLLNVAQNKGNIVIVERNGDEVIVRERAAEFSCFIRNDIDDDTKRKIRNHKSVKGMLEEGNWIRILWRDSYEREELCKKLEADGVRTYEGDVGAVRRFLTDNKIPHVVPRLCYLDIETDSRVPVRLAAEGKARILCWTVIGFDDKVTVGVLDEDTDVSERALLQRLIKTLERYDQIASWNGDNFDFPATKARCIQRRIATNFDRWLWLDQMALFIKMNTMAAESGEEKASYSLQAISTALLGVGKDDFDASKTFDAWVAGGEERQKLVRYNVTDVRRQKQIEEKTGYIALLQTLAETTNVFADSRGMNPTIQAEGFLLKLGAQKDYRFPSNFVRGYADKFKGAYVMEPKGSGIIKNVHVGDFASLYPSIIVTWNMSPETLIDGEDLERADALGVPYCRAPITGTCFLTDGEGILPHAVKEVMRLRKYWNDLKSTFPPGSDEWVSANRKATAYKIAANSFYGVVGSPMSRFFSRDVAEAVTQVGAWLIQETMREAEDRTMMSIYGDTDSLFIANCTRTQFEVFVEWCNHDFYPVKLKECGCTENLIKLAYEKEFERLIFISAKKYCNPPEAPIWMGDMTFKPLGDVKVGDEVIGWEEGTTAVRSELIKSTVVAIHKHVAPIVKVTMRSGRVIRCTSDHRWKTGTCRTTSKFVTPKVGRELAFVVEDPGSCPSSLIREASWLGGIFDGEGSLCSSGRGQIMIAQSPSHNPQVCSMIEQTLDKLGFEYSVSNQNGCNRYALKAGSAVNSKTTKLKFLRWCKPVKGPALEPAILKTRFSEKDEIVKIEADGVGEVIGMTTTTGNYVAWGYASKNCGRYIHYKGTMADASSKPEVKGLEYKRGDSIRIARNFQAEVIDLLVGMENGGHEDTETFDEVVARWQTTVLDGALTIEDISMAKRLNKPLKDYSRKRKKDGSWAKQLPHIELARKMIERGEDVREGTKVTYFVYDATHKGDVEYRLKEEWDGTFDRYEVWEKLTWPPTQRLLTAAFPGHPWDDQYGSVRPKAVRAPRATKATPKPAKATPHPTPEPALDQSPTASPASPGRRRRVSSTTSS
jgi:DNA polymerase elongation subunit (family B)